MAAAGLVLVAATAFGCSDDAGDTATEDGSVAAFCAALEEFQSAVDAADSADLAAYTRALKDAATQVASVGVPDDIPPEAEQGFELTVQRIDELPDDATQADVAALGDVTEEQQGTLDALEDYIETACPDVTG